MKLLIILFLSLCLYGDTPAQKTAENIFLANINTALLFTSESGLSSGKYNFTKVNAKMQTYSVPFTYHFKPFKKNLNWFINGSAGYSFTRMDTQTISSPTNSLLTHNNKLQTYALGLGTGLRYKSDMGIDYLADFGVIYSRVGTSINPNDKIGEAIEDFFDSEYNDNITYKFSLSANYHTVYRGYESYIKTSYKFYQTKADFTLDALTSFSTQSSLLSLEAGFETPIFFTYEENGLSLEPFIAVNYLQGDVSDIVQFERYIDIGILAYWNTPNNPSWIERFYVEMTTARADGLQGYNIGLGFTFDY